MKERVREKNSIEKESKIAREKKEKRIIIFMNKRKTKKERKSREDSSKCKDETEGEKREMLKRKSG